MRVFISWSGERSKHIAHSIREWLPVILHKVEPWMSETDIEAGQRWQHVLSKQLAECKFGIICVTPENQVQPWLNFEAGAMSEALGSEALVCPYLFGMESRQIVGPLTQFQSRKADKEGTRQLIININKHVDRGLSPSLLEKTIERWWGDWENDISKCPKLDSHSKVRSQDDILDEILENTRSIRRESANFRWYAHLYSKNNTEFDGYQGSVLRAVPKWQIPGVPAAATRSNPEEEEENSSN